MIYRGKMAYDKPKGVCLFGWRLTYFGAGLFFSTVAALVWLGHTSMESLLLALIGIEVICVFSGILLVLTNSTKKKN